VADTLFEQLDFIYMPSRDVAADVRFFADVLGARLTFAVEGMGTRVAMIELADQPPRLLLAGHLEGDRPVLVYRVADLPDAIKQLEARGWTRGQMLEIPHGPICSFTTPGGHRLAIYQLTRPEVGEHFAGRRDF
jgi:predicted enzyme related to lactoylglutathione lyase